MCIIDKNIKGKNLLEFLKIPLQSTVHNIYTNEFVQMNSHQPHMKTTINWLRRNEVIKFTH